MASAQLSKILDEVQALSPEDRQELRRRLDAWPEPQPEPAPQARTYLPFTKEERERVAEVERRMLEAGLLTRIPDPSAADQQAFREYRPIKVEGKPISETIIEERR